VALFAGSLIRSEFQIAYSWDRLYHSQGRVSQLGGLEDRVRDFVVLLDELTKWNRTDARFAGRLGLDRIGAMGFSWGGPTVARTRAAGRPMPSRRFAGPRRPGETLQGFSRPSLTMHPPDNSDQEVFAASQTNAVWFQISDTDHGSFVNYVVFGQRSAGHQPRAVRTMNAYTLSFFNKWLKGQDESLHEGSHPSSRASSTSTRSKNH